MLVGLPCKMWFICCTVAGQELVTTSWRFLVHTPFSDLLLGGMASGFDLGALRTLVMQVEEEVDLMRRHKARHLGKAVNDVELDSWDRLYYIAMAKACSLHCTHQDLKYRVVLCRLNMKRS